MVIPDMQQSMIAEKADAAKILDLKNPPCAQHGLNPHAPAP